VVYSAWSSLGDSVQHRSRYTIRTEDGNFSKEIVNHLDTFDEGPIRVSLTPGSYQLTARATDYGSVLVPVVIKEGNITYVHLDGAPHDDGIVVDGTDVIKLPSGKVVGWSTIRDHVAAN
jgi:hypothetical protein